MFDPTTKKLHFYPNSTTPGKDIVAPVLAAIFRVEGAKGVSIEGFKLTETRATFLEQYEVPSGGDWSVHRGATVEIVDSSDVTVSNCTFDQVGARPAHAAVRSSHRCPCAQIGGNGVLLSNNVQNSSISGNEFVFTGDSAVVSVGSSVGIIGTAPTFPQGNTISNNHMRNVVTLSRLSALSASLSRKASLLQTRSASTESKRVATSRPWARTIC